MPRRKPTTSSSTASKNASTFDGKAGLDVIEKPRPTVLSEEQAKALVDALVRKPQTHCALCNIQFTSEVPPVEVSFGPHPVKLCSECKERHGTYRVLGRD